MSHINILLLACVYWTISGTHQSSPIHHQSNARVGIGNGVGLKLNYLIRQTLLPQLIVTFSISESVSKIKLNLLCK